MFYKYKWTWISGQIFDAWCKSHKNNSLLHEWEGWSNDDYDDLLHSHLMWGLPVFALQSLLAIIRPPLQNKCWGWDMSRFIRISPGPLLLMTHYKSQNVQKLWIYQGGAQGHKQQHWRSLLSGFCESVWAHDWHEHLIGMCLAMCLSLITYRVATRESLKYRFEMKGNESLHHNS